MTIWFRDFPIASANARGNASLIGHLGGRTQAWEIRISDANDRLVCISRVTMAVMEGENPYL